MTDQDFKEEIDRAVGLLQDNTWNVDDFKARMLQLVNDEGFRPAFERYIWNVQEMRRLQERYYKGDKGVIGKCRGQETKVDTYGVQHLKRMGITNLENFQKRYSQQSLF